MAYRYGFNSMERDDEVKGKGISYDFGARMYDPRVGRFLSLDRFARDFPSESSYIFSGNSPIIFKDLNGDFKIKITEEAKKRGATEIKMQRFISILKDLSNYLEQNPRVVDVIAEQTGLSKEQIMNDAVYGEGPTIYITSTNKGMHYNVNNGRIEFDYSLIEFLENYNSDSDLENAALNLEFVGSIFHEYTHEEDYKLNGSLTSDPDADPSEGKQGTKSKFNHRGVDVEMSITGTSQNAITVGEGDYNFYIDIQDIRRVMNRITLEKTDTSKPYSKKNSLPIDQKTAPRY